MAADPLSGQLRADYLSSRQDLCVNGRPYQHSRFESPVEVVGRYAHLNRTRLLIEDRIDERNSSREGFSGIGDKDSTVILAVLGLTEYLVIGRWILSGVSNRTAKRAGEPAGARH